MQLMVINTYYILSSYMTSGGDVIVTPHAFSINDHRYSLCYKTSSGDDSVRCPHLPSALGFRPLMMIVVMGMITIMMVM